MGNSNFVDDEPVRVALEGDPNAVYILPKMDYRTLARVKKLAKEATGGVTQEQDASFYIDTWNLVLLEANIVKWEGPDFDGRAVTPEAIGKWDPDAPLLTEVLKKINDFNFKKADKEGTSPNSPTTATSARSKVKRSKAR